MPVVTMTEVFTRSIGEGRCRSCDAPITWVESVKTGKKNPLNGHGLVALKLGRDPETGLETSFFELDSHFATCPDAAKFRRKR